MPDMSSWSEHLERAALTDLHAAAPRELKSWLGLQLKVVDGVTVSIAAGDKSVVLNRAIGLGLDSPATPTTIERIVGLYRAAGVGRYFIHVTPRARPAELPEWLSKAGLVKARGWVKFTRATAPPAALVSDLTVRRIGADRAQDFGRIAAAAFDLSEAAGPLLAALADRPNWHLYLSFAGAEPAGTGALFVQKDVAWIDWGATAPAFRRRGGQGAVLAQRVRDALAMGCRMMVTATGEAVPGDPQHSYKNILKVGFQESYLRENWAPPQPGEEA